MKLGGYRAIEYRIYLEKHLHVPRGTHLVEHDGPLLLICSQLDAEVQVS